jgi:phosphatidylserine synthase
MILAGVLYFLNTVLDNMDGKQARRTGSGSPMGMLFDHGSDAFTALFSAIMLSRYFQFGNGVAALAGLILPTVPFFFCNLAEYYTGCLDLPALFGPEDMQLGVSICCWLVAYFGTNDTYDDNFDFGFGRVRLTHIILVLALMFEFIGMGGNVYSAIIAKKDSEHFKMRFNFTCFMTQILILPIMIVVWTSYMFVPGTKSRDGDYNFLLTTCYAAQFLQATHRLMVCDVTLAPFYAIRRTHVLVWTLLAANAVFLFTSEGR